MTQLFDTHKFLFTLNYNKEIKNHTVEFVDKDNNKKTIKLEKIDIGTSPISCKLYDQEGNRYLIPFIRINKIFKNKELVWDNSDANKENVKIIKGYK